jgi:hypothetical protein
MQWQTESVEPTSEACEVVNILTKTRQRAGERTERAMMVFSFTVAFDVDDQLLVEQAYDDTRSTLAGQLREAVRGMIASSVGRERARATLVRSERRLSDRDASELRYEMYLHAAAPHSSDSSD